MLFLFPRLLKPVRNAQASMLTAHRTNERTDGTRNAAYGTVVFSIWFKKLSFKCKPLLFCLKKINGFKENLETEMSWTIYAASEGLSGMTEMKTHCNDILIASQSVAEACRLSQCVGSGSGKRRRRHSVAIVVDCRPNSNGNASNALVPPAARVVAAQPARREGACPHFPNIPDFLTPELCMHRIPFIAVIFVLYF